MEETKGWDSDDLCAFVWSAFGILVLSILVTLLATAVVHDHKVTNYYAANGNDQNSCKWIPEENRTVCSTPVCVWGDIPWSADTKVNCQTDWEKAVEEIRQLNETVK